MKRFLPLLLSVLVLIGCTSVPEKGYSGSFFHAALPEPFEPVDRASILCFAPHGDPLCSSSITVLSTELNWYFDRYTPEEYAEAIRTLCGYDNASVEAVKDCRVDRYSSKRIACKVRLDQGTHDLIIYAVNGQKTYFFTLLNRENDPYIDAFDTMMKSLMFTEES